MPLIKSKSKAALNKNISTEIKAGKDPKVAAAIGYSVQRKAKGNEGHNPSRKRVRRSISR